MSLLLTPSQKPLIASSMHAPESCKLMKKHESSAISLQFGVEMCPMSLKVAASLIF